MAMYARWTKSGYRQSYSEASINASYSNGRVTITLTSSGQWTPSTTFRLHGSSEQTIGWDWFCGSNYGGRGRTVTFTHDVTQNGTYSYYVSVDHREMDGILHVGLGVRGHLVYDGSTGWVSVNVTDRYVPKTIDSITLSEVSVNSRPALKISNARNTDGTQANIQVNINGSGWQNYSEGMIASSYAPGSTITVEARNTDTPSTVISRTITLSYGTQPTATVQAIPIANTAECIVTNSNGSYSVVSKQYSLDNTTWVTFTGSSFTLTGLLYDTDYTVYYKTTYSNNVAPGRNYLTVSTRFSTPVPKIEHSIKAINTFKHLEDKSGSTGKARFLLELKDGITLQSIFLGEQIYNNYTYDTTTKELVVQGLTIDQIYTITAYATDINGDGEYATVKFQTNGKIYDSVLEDPTSGNHVAPITFMHNVYNDNFTKNQGTINSELNTAIANEVQRATTKEGQLETQIASQTSFLVLYMIHLADGSLISSKQASSDPTVDNSPDYVVGTGAQSAPTNPTANQWLIRLTGTDTLTVEKYESGSWVVKSTNVAQSGWLFASKSNSHGYYYFNDEWNILDQNFSVVNADEVTITSVNDVLSVKPGGITGTQLANNIAIPGSPTTTTQSTGDSSTKIATTAFVAGEITANNATINTALNGKQNTLTAGTNITIDSNNVISASSTAPSNMMTLDTVQNVIANKTFSGNVAVTGNFGVADNSVAQWGGTPTANNHLANKAYVDSVAGATPSNMCTTDTNQTISGTKSFSSVPNTSGTPTQGTDIVNKTYVDTALTDKLNKTDMAIITTAPTSANTDGYVKFVVLSAEPANKYSGYIYFITE